ncbi:MAG: hypothetical protein WCG25_01010 [bacterium]
MIENRTFLPVSVDKNINKRVIVDMIIHIIDFRLSLAPSAMFFKIIVMVGSSIFWKLFAISKIQGKTKANKEIIATIVITINIIG